MELFYGQLASEDLICFDPEQSAHIVKVMRHKPGDSICAMDGSGTLFKGTLINANPKECSARIIERLPGWGVHPYTLELAVCPTKNNERTEWMAEKVTEAGVDVLSPVIGERSERKVYKTERMRRIVLSAAKQSLKTKLAQVNEPVSVLDFIQNAPKDALKLIAYCFEGEKHSIREVLEASGNDHIVILIGPEGDFSPKEVAEAIKAGFKPVHLGNSRLRTETAAICAAMSVYYKYM